MKPKYEENLDDLFYKTFDVDHPAMLDYAEMKLELKRLRGLLEAQVSKANGDTEEDFTKELQSLINRHSKENGSNTPDFILAHYLNRCLDTFDIITKRREKWYGRN